MSNADKLTQKRRIAEHVWKIEEFEVFRGVLVELRDQIIIAEEEQYLHSLKQPLVGYNQMMAYGMLELLFNSCKLGALDLNNLEGEIKEPWTSDNHINEFICKFTEKRKKWSQSE